MILIVDFYVDEPACLGVPPYLSPYCRYVAGVLADAGVSTEQIGYLTVDQWRESGRELSVDPELVVLVAGVTVPGKYLGGKIGTVADILSFLEFRRNRQPGATTLIGGPIRHAPPDILEQIRNAGGVVTTGDIEDALDSIIRNPGGIRVGAAAEKVESEKGAMGWFRRDYSRIDRWAAAGAFITQRHPNFPYLMLEMESYRGCTRRNHCSFCSEVFYGRPVFRPVRGILEEVGELYQAGNRYFRLGRQADLLTYGADMTSWQNGFPRPVPGELSDLYSGIRRVAPDLKVLHLDNINPGAVAAFETEASEIVRIIAEHNTPGDTAAMGLESADPLVGEINDLKCTSDQALRAIELINQFGGHREGGIPKLLPGLNLISGLPGESDRTFELNFDFLKSLLEGGLLLRRINIRQITIHPKTRAEKLAGNSKLTSGMGISKKHRNPALLKKKFIYYRDKIRAEIDLPMMRAVFPPGTILREVIPEDTNPGYVLGRQLGSYPVTVKIPISDPAAGEALENGQPLDVIVTGIRERSLIGLSWPIAVNRLGRTALGHIPGVGAKRATRLLLARPLKSMAELMEIVEVLPVGDASSFSFEMGDE